MSDQDRFIRRHKQLLTQAKERKAKELVEQQEIQSVKEKIQQQLLTMADLKAQIDGFKNADHASTKTASVTTNNADKISDNEEQYKTAIIERMVALIKQRKMK